MVLVVASRRWMGGWGVGVVVVVVKGDLPRSLPIVRPEQDFSTYCARFFFSYRCQNRFDALVCAFHDNLLHYKGRCQKLLSGFFPFPPPPP